MVRHLGKNYDLSNLSEKERQATLDTMKFEREVIHPRRMKAFAIFGGVLFGLFMLAATGVI